MERVEELTKDKVRLVEENEAKLAKAQECYERELEAMRRTHQLTTENLLAWKRTEVTPNSHYIILIMFNRFHPSVHGCINHSFLFFSSPICCSESNLVL